MNRSWRRTLPAALAIFCALTATIQADDPPRFQGDPEARRLIDEVARAYKALDAYADQGEFHTKVTLDGKTDEQTTPVRIALLRPDHLRIETRLAVLTCDGKTLTTAVNAFHRFENRPAPKAVTVDTFQEGPVGSVLFGSPLGRPMFVLANLLVGADPAKVIAGDLGGNLKLEPDREIDGASCRVIRIDNENVTDYLLLIDPRTNRLQGIDVVPDSKRPADDFPEGGKVTLQQFGWRAGKIVTDPAPELFSTALPKGYSKIEPYTAAPAEDAPKHRVEDLVGKPAPDFALSILDAEGKFRRVTKADLAGKVVLLDFWATWCAPCMAELPEIQKLIEAYGKDGKEVVIVALSEDQRPSELGEVRKLVEKTLDQKKIKLTVSPSGKIALDPSGTIGEAFQVEGLPTLVLLDAKGIVRSAHVGFSPDVGAMLRKEIDTVLKGEALAPPKAKE